MIFFLDQILTNLTTFSSNLAFSIENRNYSYNDLSERIVSIQRFIEGTGNEQYFGVITRNSIDTYAAIFALWLSGKTSVPLGTKNPHARNNYIVKQVGIRTVFDSNPEPLCFDDCHTILTSGLRSDGKQPYCKRVSLNTDLYVLFTSGSTGAPKGVRISQSNLEYNLKAFFSFEYQIDSNDRFLQPFDLTFDASIQSFTVPLLKGASVFTLPDVGVKYLSIYKTIKEHSVTITKTTPSFISYLQPYFHQIHLPSLRYCIFGAEALPLQLVEKWAHCIPNAIIHNVYGPTELTINCSLYKWVKEGGNKSFNGIVSIGKSYPNLDAIVIDEVGTEQATGNIGELCFAGPQVSTGYWKNDELNQKAFFDYPYNGESIRFYRTGDIAFKDEDGDIFFVGRKDSQVQVDGHRIELGEIEHHASSYMGKRCIAMSPNHEGLSRTIVLFVESNEMEYSSLLDFLATVIPKYMIPSKVYGINPFPILTSGKVDRKKLQNFHSHA